MNTSYILYLANGYTDEFIGAYSDKAEAEAKLAILRALFPERGWWLDTEEAW